MISKVSPLGVQWSFAICRCCVRIVSPTDRQEQTVFVNPASRDARAICLLILAPRESRQESYTSNMSTLVCGKFSNLRTSVLRDALSQAWRFGICECYKLETSNRHIHMLSCRRSSLGSCGSTVSTPVYVWPPCRRDRGTLCTYDNSGSYTLGLNILCSVSCACLSLDNQQILSFVDFLHRSWHKRGLQPGQ